MITILQKNISNRSQYIVFDIKKLELECNLPFDIFIKKENGFVLIVKSSTFISQDIYYKLSKQTTLYISVDNNSLKQLNCTNIRSFVVINLDLNKKILELLYKVHSVNYTYLLAEHYKEDAKLCLESIIETIIYILTEKKDFLKDTIKYFSHEYKLETHSLHVAIFAVNLGIALKFPHEKLLQIGVAGLAHDIGVKSIDENILHKDSQLTPAEIALIHHHPQESALITKHNHIHNPYIIDAITHHHERYDGSGYPGKLVRKEIGEFASILGICDTFDALTNERPYRKRFTYFEALKFMMKDESMINKFNTDYLKAFLKSLI